MKFTGRFNMKSERKPRAESNAKVLVEAMGRLGLPFTVMKKAMNGSRSETAQFHDQRAFSR